MRENQSELAPGRKSPRCHVNTLQDCLGFPFMERLIKHLPLCLMMCFPHLEVDPCHSYKELREFQRSQYYRLSELEYAKCDSQLLTSWYRFRGRAGLRMPDYCVKTGSCGTHAPGWFQGAHPTVSGAVSSGKVCFSWWRKGCCYWYMNVKVKKCSDFYIYQLPETLGCDLYYCGDGAPGKDNLFRKKNLKNNVIIIHPKYFAVSDWPAPIPRLILHNQLARTR